MKNIDREEEVIVHPVDGMQLSCGYIRMVASRRFVGRLPGMISVEGESIVDVLRLMDRRVKSYYGDDVVAEIVHHSVGAR